MKEIGRPTIYSDGVISEFLQRVMDGRGLVSVCRDNDMPCKTTIYAWLADDIRFSDRYVNACKIRAEVIAERMITKIEEVEHDKDAIAQARLELDAKKWFLAKLAPTKYGDKAEIITNDDAGEIEIRVVRVSKNKDAD